jgi:flagellar motor switch/type III secretory pathway protein FliN
MNYHPQTVAFSNLAKVLGFSSTHNSSEKSKYNNSILSLDWALLNINIIEVCRKFCELPIEGKLIAITEDLDKAEWKGLTTKWQIWSDSPESQLRVDKKFAQILLAQTLGSKETDVHFSCNELTELEREVLETQIGEIVNYINESYEDIDSYNPNLAGKFFNLIWLTELNGEVGKVALSLPAEFLPINEAYTNKHESRTEEDCRFASLKVNLQVGHSKVSLADIAKMEVDDMFLLNESNKNHLSIIGNDDMHYAVPLFVGAKKLDSKWHKMKLNDSDLREIKKDMSQVLNKDVLGDFPVEVKAEFKDVKMTLKDLFALQSGWVLPIDQVAENELFLTSQGKTIAKGELVVAGNKLGILIKEIFLGESKA